MVLIKFHGFVGTRASNRSSLHAQNRFTYRYIIVINIIIILVIYIIKIIVIII